MTDQSSLSPHQIRAKRDDLPALRDRDFADQLGISEADLVAAYCGQGTTRIDPSPDTIMAAAQNMGEVMALTRNRSCVHERIGTYTNYQSGNHASMVLGPEIDLRIFPSHWRHAFLVERDTAAGLRRSVQVFDAAGDAVHKIILRDQSNLEAWSSITPLADQSQTIATDPRMAPEAPKSDLSKLDVLRKEWARMTDTHQFMRLTSKLKMNRLGAYRIAGAPYVRQLSLASLEPMLHAVRDAGIEVMVFVGNKGCIQIHSGLLANVTPMGPWQNVLDPRFNLHLRQDHVAEIWAVEKPTQRGPAVSVEGFDADGALIFQMFGHGKNTPEGRDAWNHLVTGLEGLVPEAVS